MKCTEIMKRQEHKWRKRKRERKSTNLPTYVPVLATRFCQWSGLVRGSHRKREREREVTVTDDQTVSQSEHRLTRNRSRGGARVWSQRVLCLRLRKKTNTMSLHQPWPDIRKIKAKKKHYSITVTLQKLRKTLKVKEWWKNFSLLINSGIKGCIKLERDR